METRKPILGILLIILLGITACSVPDNPVGQKPSSANYPGFKQIKAGTYEVGVKGHPINPKRTVQLKAFWIAVHEVTNAQFAEFVEATNYVTLAEKYHNALVFRPGLGEFKWLEDSTAFWRFPNGKEAYGIEGKMDHPVTCISFKDAVAYCKWAGVRLPTADEWEVASRAGSKEPYFFGATADSLGIYANIWHGVNHSEFSDKEKFRYTAPVASFAPNKFGLYDVYGNVFEFCSDRPEYFKNREGVACSRGGSWWCSANSCNYYNSVDIGRVKQIATFSNQGFRLVRK